MATATSTVK